MIAFTMKTKVKTIRNKSTRKRVGLGERELLNFIEVHK